MSKKTMASVERALAISNQQVLEARAEITDLRERLVNVCGVLDAFEAEMDASPSHIGPRLMGIRRYAYAHDIPTVARARKPK